MGHKIQAALAGVLSVGLLAGCQIAAEPAPSSTVEQQVYYPLYESYAELAEQADTVVVGEVLSQEQVELDYSVEGSGQADPHQVFAVKLTAVVFGDAQPGDTIQVAQYGGTVDGVLHSEAGGHPLEVGQTYGLILQEVAGKPALTFAPGQSIYPLHDDGTFQSLWSENPIAEEVTGLLATFGGNG